MDFDTEMRSEDEDNCQTSEGGNPVRFCTQRESNRRLDAQGNPGCFQPTSAIGARAPKRILVERNVCNREGSSQVVHFPNNMGGVETTLLRKRSFSEISGAGVASSPIFQAPPPNQFRLTSPSLAAAVSTDFQVPRTPGVSYRTTKQSTEFLGKETMEKKRANMPSRESRRKRGRSPDLNLGLDQQKAKKCKRLNDKENTIDDLS